MAEMTPEQVARIVDDIVSCADEADGGMEDARVYADQLAGEIAALRAERDAIAAARDNLLAENEALGAARDSAERERSALAHDYAALVAAIKRWKRDLESFADADDEMMSAQYQKQIWESEGALLAHPLPADTPTEDQR